MLHFPYEPLLHSCAPNLTLGICKMFMIFFEPFFKCIFFKCSLQLIVLPGLLARTFFKALSNIHLFFTVWEAGSPRSGCEPWQGEGPLPGCRLLLVSSHGRKGKDFSCISQPVQGFLVLRFLCFHFKDRLKMQQRGVDD